MKFIVKITIVLWLVAGATGILSGAAAAQQEAELPNLDDNILSQIAEEESLPLADNFPRFNRTMHDFNFFMDKVFVRPVAGVYKQVTPAGVRRSVGNFFGNLGEPFSGVNNILQGDFEQAGNNFRRFFVNTLLGVGGLFDVASQMGHAPDHEDFGQTLAVWGVGDGGYLVLPFLGPGTLRSGFGQVPDGVIAANGISVPEDADFETWAAVRYGLVVNQRADDVEALRDLEANSVDFYAAVRAIYWQNRLNQINR